MNSAEFWSRLEYRLCAEFRGMTEGTLSEYWCDGFIPGAYLIHDSVPKVLGNVWIVERQEQQEWKFELFLPKQYVSTEEIDWKELLPPDDVTRWLAIDREGRRIQIEPMAAVPDEKTRR